MNEIMFKKEFSKGSRSTARRHSGSTTTGARFVRILNIMGVKSSKDLKNIKTEEIEKIKKKLKRGEGYGKKEA